MTDLKSFSNQGFYYDESNKVLYCPLTKDNRSIGSGPDSQIERERELQADVTAAVLTNLGNYQDSKHLHVHIRSGGRVGTD